MLHDRLNEKQRKLTALGALALNYNKALPEELCEVWMRMLAKYEAEVVELACEKVMLEYEYKTLPPFAVLAKAIRQVSGELEPEQAREVAAASEWDALLQAVSRYGRYNMPALDERTEHAIRVMGGWDAVCNWETDKLEWKRKEFLEHWTQYAEHHDTMALPAEDILALAQEPQGMSRRVEIRQQKLPTGPTPIGKTLASIGFEQREAKQEEFVF